MEDLFVTWDNVLLSESLSLVPSLEQLVRIDHKMHNETCNSTWSRRHVIVHSLIIPWKGVKYKEGSCYSSLPFSLAPLLTRDNKAIYPIYFFTTQALLAAIQDSGATSSWRCCCDRLTSGIGIQVEKNLFIQG